MARLWSCGFELAGSFASMPTSPEIHVASGTGGAIQTTTKRSGTYALRIGGAATPLVSGVSSGATFRFVNTAASGPYYGRAYLYIVTLPSAANTIMALVGAGAPVRVTLDSAGILTLIDEDGTIGSAASGLALNTWYRLEIEVDGTGAGATDVVKLYVDGAQVAGSSTRDVAGTVHSFSIAGNGNNEAQTQGEWYFDDVAVNDNGVGGTETGLPGAGSIVHLWPNGDGDADVAVTRSSGATTPTGTDRGANWQQLGNAFDKPSPNDATDFLLLTGTTSEVIVDCEPASTVGISNGDSIKFVAVGARIACATAAAGNWIPKILTSAAGTKVSGATVAIAVTTWHSHDDTTGTQQYKLTQYTDPQAGGPWTAALLNTMQLDAATTDGNPDTIVTALWALIEFNASVAKSLPPLMMRTVVRTRRRVI